MSIYQIFPDPLNPNSTDPRISGNVEILEEVDCDDDDEIMGTDIVHTLGCILRSDRIQENPKSKLVEI